MTPAPLLTVADVAAQLALSASYVRAAVARGEIACEKYGRAIRIAPAEVQRFRQRHAQVAEDHPAPSRELPPAPAFPWEQVR